MLWVLDDGPLQALCRVAGRDLLKWQPNCIGCAESTWLALKNPANLVTSPLMDSGVIQVLTIPLDSREWQMLYDHLRTNYLAENQADMAEHECIAWIANTSHDARFVTLDKGAFYLASGELGAGRVYHACDYWHHLRTKGLLNDDQFSDLLKLTYSKQGSVIPRRYVPVT